MHDKLVYRNEPPPAIKACVMHPSVQSSFSCERPGNETFIMVKYGICFKCAVRLEADVDYIRLINTEIDERLTEVQRRIE